jgi:hypothetical protein
MLRRLILLILTGVSYLCFSAFCFSFVIIMIFKQRHPDHCMAEYYNFFLPKNVEYKCDQ